MYNETLKRKKERDKKIKLEKTISFNQCPHLIESMIKFTLQFNNHFLKLLLYFFYSRRQNETS